MNKHGVFEKRKPYTKWATIDEARRGLQGDADSIERQAKARMDAQALFKRIREGKL